MNADRTRRLGATLTRGVYCRACLAYLMNASPEAIEADLARLRDAIAIDARRPCDMCGVRGKTFGITR